MLSNVRAKLLALPTTMAAVTAVEADQKIVKELLSKAVEQALTELSAIDVLQVKREVVKVRFPKP